MIETDVARWRFQCNSIPWRLARINGRRCFGWVMESLAGTITSDGKYDVEIVWRVLPCDHGLYRKATLADLLQLELTWWKSHKLDAALVAMAAVSTVVFFGRAAWLIWPLSR